MTKEVYLALAETQYEALKTLGQEGDFYALEETFDQLWTAFGRSVLEQTIGQVPADHRKKTLFRPVSGP